MEMQKRSERTSCRQGVKESSAGSIVTVCIHVGAHWDNAVGTQDNFKDEKNLTSTFVGQPLVRAKRLRPQSSSFRQ